MKTTIPTAKYRHPKTQIKKLWVGGHYSCIFFFKKKPKKTKYLRNNIKYYCIVDNKDLVVGSIYNCDFETLYPDFDMELLTPKEIEIVEVFPIMFEAVYDSYGKFEQFFYHAQD